MKGEIQGCDVVGVRGDEPPVVVELKRVFGLAVVLQGMDRLAMTDAVYVAVGAWPRQLAESRRLCRRVGLGLIVVADGRAEVLEDPVPYRPRRDARRVGRLLREHARRVGDPATGGSTRIPIMTAYRQEAIRCLRLLGDGPLAGALAARHRDGAQRRADPRRRLLRLVRAGRPWHVRPDAGRAGDARHARGGEPRPCEAGA